MPSPRKTTKAKLAGLASGEAEPVELTASGRALVEKVSAEYELDATGATLLRLAAESLSVAERAAAIVKREGMTFLDVRDNPRIHPAATLEKDSRNAAAASLQKLALQLGD